MNWRNFDDKDKYQKRDYPKISVRVVLWPRKGIIKIASYEGSGVWNVDGRTKMQCQQEIEKYYSHWCYIDGPTIDD